MEDDPEFATSMTNNQIKTLSAVYVSALTLSLLGSLSVIVVSVAKRRRLNEQARPLLQLALADFLAAALLLFTSAANLLPTDWLPYRVQICQRVLPLSLAFYFVSFLLVVVYACESKQAAEGWRERASRDEAGGRGAGLIPLFLYLMVWVVPMAIYVWYVCTESLTEASIIKADDDSVSNEAMDKHYTLFCSSCILLLHISNDSCSHVDPGHDMFVKWFFLISLTLMLICCTVVYHNVSSWLRRRQEEQAVLPLEGDGFTRRRLRGLCMTTRSMVLVIIVCWAPALVLVALSFSPSISQEKLFPLYVTQALTVSLHGFLDSIVYGWLRQNFREAVRGERMPLLVKAFYDESLTMH